MISPNSIVGKPFQLPVLSVNGVTPSQVSVPASLPSAGIPGSAATQGNPLLQTLAALQQTLSLMTQNSAPSSGFALDYSRSGGGGLAAAPTGTTGNLTPNSLATAAIQSNTTKNPQQKQQLDGILAKVASDPEGSALLQAALAKGYTIEIGDPSAAIGAADSAGISHDAATCAECQAAALDGTSQINGVTIPGQKKIVVNPNAENVVKTLVHELGHAATEADGNSKDEEGKVDVIGYRVAERITGIPAPPANANLDGLTKGRLIYQSKIANPAYANLAATNNVDRILNSLGIFA